MGDRPGDDEVQSVEVGEPDLAPGGERMPFVDHEHLRVRGDLGRFEPARRGVVSDDGQVGPAGGDGREGGFPVGGDDLHASTLPRGAPDRLGDHPAQRPRPAAMVSVAGESWWSSRRNSSARRRESSAKAASLSPAAVSTRRRPSRS